MYTVPQKLTFLHSQDAEADGIVSTFMFIYYYVMRSTHWKISTENIQANQTDLVIQSSVLFCLICFVNYVCIMILLYEYFFSKPTPYCNFDIIDHPRPIILFLKQQLTWKNKKRIRFHKQISKKLKIFWAWQQVSPGSWFQSLCNQITYK